MKPDWPSRLPNPKYFALRGSVFVQPKNHHLTFGYPNISRAPFHQPRDGATRRPSRPILCSLQKSSQTSSPMLVPAAEFLGRGGRCSIWMEPYLENHPTLRIHLPLLWKQARPSYWHTRFQGLKTGRFDTPAGIPRILRAILNPWLPVTTWIYKPDK